LSIPSPALGACEGRASEAGEARERPFLLYLLFSCVYPFLLQLKISGFFILFFYFYFFLFGVFLLLLRTLLGSGRGSSGGGGIELGELGLDKCLELTIAVSWFRGV
jgi:hypothetical protein